MIEYLCHQGHREADLFDHSVDRIRDLYADAQARQARDNAVLELSMMNAVANGAGALMSKKGVGLFNKAQARLLARANDDESKQDVPGNIKGLSENLLSIGARRSYSQPKWKTKSQ